jgi:hypothetical protein
MKKFVTIFLLLSYLFSMTELHQILKTPLLVEHYYEHNDKEELSVLTFLEMHYLNGNVKDADYEKDMKLPFKSFQDNHPNVVLSLPETTSFFNFFSYPISEQKSFSFENQVNTSNFFTSIWQPPKTILS